MQDLTGFQRDILYVVSGGNEPNGRTVGKMLDEYYEREIVSQNVYYNRDVLIEDGYLEYLDRKGREKPLRLTEEGHQSIVERRHWEDGYVELTGDWEEDPEEPSLSIAEYRSSRRDVLYIVAVDELMLGSDVVRELDAYYPSGARRGLAYRSLSDGVERGVVTKTKLDGSHTSFELSVQGVRTLEARRAWESQYIEL